MKVVEIKHRGEVAVVTPDTLLVGGRETAELDSEVHKLDTAGNRYLVINLERMKLMGSPGFAAIVAAYRAYQRRGATMALCCPHPRVAKFLSLVKPAFLIDVYKTEDEAVGAIQKAGPR
jgi:anti-anti-sigma factor